MLTSLRNGSLLVVFAAAAAGAAPPGHTVSVGYLTIGGRLSVEDSSAVSWISLERDFSLRILDASRVPLDNPGVDVVWIHAADSAAWADWITREGKLRLLGAYYRKGGKLLCTGIGAVVPYLSGIESVRPDVIPLQITDDWLFDQKGLQGFRGHPVFDGLFGGVFTWDSNTDNVAYRVGYFTDRSPREGKVVGVEKSYITVESDNKLMVEYSDGGGRAMTIGAYVRFSPPNARALHLRKFVHNALEYLAGVKPPVRPTYWLKSGNQPLSFPVRTAALPPPRSAIGRLPESGLMIPRGAPANEFFDVAGRRALVMGKENGGIDEVWVHPFRVVRDYCAGLVFGDSIRRLADLPVSLEIRPESFTRTYRTPAGNLKEIVFPSFRKGGVLVHYEWLDGARGQPLCVAYRADLRWMWPYDERALGSVMYGYDGGLGALHVKDTSGDFYSVIGGDIRPAATLSGPFSRIVIAGGKLRGDTTRENQVYHASIYNFSGGTARALNIAIVGTDQGRDRALADYRDILADPAAEYGRLVAHYRSLLDRTVAVETPDSSFDRRWRWAIVGVDRFITETPRLGTALVAGYSTVDSGWDGGQKISGRPGYAWYFGRDAAWSGFAIDDYGDAPAVRRQLELFRKYQDLTGKIFHELSTSGVVHYDAADATPLYILLAGHYLRASGDGAFLRRSWPSLKKAMDFLYSTDTDGDLLIENTGVGHGWVEGGKLWPVHTEFYLAGIWGEALEEASWMASRLGENALAEKYGRDAAAVKTGVDSAYWDPKGEMYSYGKLRDGSYNTEPTILPAPVMYFGWLGDAKVLRVLRRYASNAFSTDWGTRIISEESSLFSPTGYHYGSVWPLFTGWTSLAEYAYGNSVQGFTLLMDNMQIEDHWAAGFVQEVMNGAVYRPAGVCPHQCWSETNILHPGIHGMIGWRPDATRDAAVLSPRFPINWDRVRVRNLRVGRSVIDVLFVRRDHLMTYRMVRKGPHPVTVELAPELPEGTTISRVTVDGRTVGTPVSLKRGVFAAPVRVLVDDSTEIRLAYSGGVEVVPVVHHASPGDSSQGFRFLGASLDGAEFGIDVEGKSGSDDTLDVRVLDRKVVSVSGGTVVRETPEGIVAVRIQFASSPRRWLSKRVVVRLEEDRRPPEN